MKNIKYLYSIFGILSSACLVFPFILVACSSTEQVVPLTNSTEFNKTGSVKDGDKFKNIFASNAKDHIRDLSDYIFNNLITGKKDKLSSDAIGLIKIV